MDAVADVKAEQEADKDARDEKDAEEITAKVADEKKVVDDAARKGKQK